MKTKKNTLAYLIVLIMMMGISGSAKGQLLPPAAGKSVVYFFRPDYDGFIFNVTCLDSNKLIGRIEGGRYIRYECEPGHHLFWVRGENRDYVEANLASDKIYFLYSETGRGAVTVRVKLFPVVATKRTKQVNYLLYMLEHQSSVAFTEEELKRISDNLSDEIADGLKRYAKEEEKGSQHRNLTADMFYPFSGY